ncbi:MAG: hypothetical protein A2W90_17300 [Bacteroidetes bacterium GWF2_42_66]|nr:MAG: hypothetical protein A2W92_21465 [Bacteroidetes bacterium GWA2_42_15]OFX97656.1 MAG: hypothetical protein A2W89_19435 [Bacteroidetes bacterium GWE2_42_39]OFY46904.1 MAG: hypothetical protein A2W90_17300 [Bacteroidetes bacterium GWF2_42_66]HBL75738.1 hypothetical protein [Prolixibacteraceae bacterium]HCU59579.1 hypothetical protein [Prolixibacteraceae bacterium]
MVGFIVFEMKGILLLGLLFLLLSGERMLSQTIQFAGQTWNVRSGTGNPGNNNWSASSQSVWVDEAGRLHMKIRKEGDKWYCAEIISQQSFGYGEYIFYVASHVEKYDPSVVAAMFTYENDNREIDIEFTNSGFGSTSKTDTPGWYTVQPRPYTTANQYRFKLNLTEDYSTHKFVWSSKNIFFQSYHGHYPQLPSSEYQIAQWTYTGTKNPPTGSERLHINLYLLGGAPPTNQQEVEFVVNAVFLPLGSLKVVLSPSTAITGGAMWRIDKGEWQSSGSTLPKISNCHHTISFSPVPGWHTPSDTIVLVKATEILNIDINYQLNTGAPIWEETELKIFPNPASENLIIELPQYSGNGQLFVFDNTGRLVHSKSITDFPVSLDVSDFSEGLYFLKIAFENNIFTKKVLIQR